MLGYCVAIGIPSTQVSAVLAVTSGLGAVGRILSGQIADMIGPINVIISFGYISGLMCLVVWLPARSLGAMMAYGILWGFFSPGALPFWWLDLQNLSN